MKKKIIALILLVGIGLIATAKFSLASTTTNTNINPSSPVFDSNHVNAVNDPAPGFESGSFKSDGVGKTDMYFTPQMLFGHSITIADIKNISYWTKKGTTHVSDPGDWSLVIYTDPYSGDVSTPTWYGDRIGSEPYFSINLNDPANDWHEWSTNGVQNQMRFYESTQGAPGANFGTYNDPNWDTFKSSNALSDSPYSGHSILYFSLQTGSAWASGFTGQLDGFKVELTDGSIATVNMEDVSAPTVPEITFPGNGDTLTSAQMVKVDWTDSTGSTAPILYQYQAFSDPNYTSQVYDSGMTLTNSEIPTPGTPIGTYYLRVRAQGSTGPASDWSNDVTHPYKVTVAANAFAVPAQCNQNISYNVINGKNKAENINGTSGNDLIYGNGGADVINGKGGDDCIVSGKGASTIHGGDGNDVIIGGNAADRLYGDAGDDKLYGNGGADTLDGGTGDDLLDGGAAADRAIGGSGTDTCIAESKNSCEM